MHAPRISGAQDVVKRAWVVEAVHFLMYSLSEQAAEMPDEATREKRRLLDEAQRAVAEGSDAITRMEHSAHMLAGNPISVGGYTYTLPVWRVLSWRWSQSVANLHAVCVSQPSAVWYANKELRERGLVAVHDAEVHLAALMAPDGGLADADHPVLGFEQEDATPQEQKRTLLNCQVGHREVLCTRSHVAG